MAQSGPPVAFVNKALLEHTVLIGLCMLQGCFHTTVAKLSSCDRYHMACKAENIYWLAVQKKLGDAWFRIKRSGGEAPE